MSVTERQPDKDAGICIRVHGFTLNEIEDRLGGFGRDKPIRAVSYDDVFDEASKLRAFVHILKDRLAKYECSASMNANNQGCAKW
jgi:hypothetical protein